MSYYYDYHTSYDGYILFPLKKSIKIGNRSKFHDFQQTYNGMAIKAALYLILGVL